MEKMTTDQMVEIARKLLGVASVFAPNNGAAIIDLFEIGAEFNKMIRNIKEQTKENEAEVWEQIRDHATGALNNFEQSVADNKENG